MNKKNQSQRLNEVKIMKDGNMCSIIEYNNYNNITVEFKLTKEKINTTYKEFKNGSIKSHFSPTVYNIGIVGLEKTKDLNGKKYKSYNAWHDMLRRCYDKKLHDKRNTYKECSVCEEWYAYSNFKIWFNNNYYEIEGQQMHLDKDILIKGNKLYSPETCVFVPNDINSLFTKSDKARGNYPIGVYYSEKKKKFVAQIKIPNKTKRISKHLGYFNEEIEAFNYYKLAKEKLIKHIADDYKNEIPQELYEAMYRYIVEITD